MVRDFTSKTDFNNLQVIGDLKRISYDLVHDNFKINSKSLKEIKMSNSVEIYLGNFIYILVIMKLLRMDLLSKSLLYISLTLFGLFGFVGMGIGMIGVPFLLFGSSNETLEIVIKASIPIIVVVLYVSNKKDIHSFIFEIKYKLKKEISLNNKTIRM